MAPSKMYAPDAGFPRASPCASFWTAHQSSSEFIGFRSTQELPKEADVVIIGSGITGAATAYFSLSSTSPPARMVMLEARELSSGATGRNGGHCRPDPFRNFKTYENLFGTEQAIKVIENEFGTLYALDELIKKEKIDCDWNMGTTIDVLMSPESSKRTNALIEHVRAAYPKLDRILIQHITDPAEAKRFSRVGKADSVVEFPGGSVYPMKLVFGLLRICMQKGLNVQSNTPARGVTLATDGIKWLVKTDRGDILTKQVVHATNAFAGSLLPEFKPLISPFRGQCTAWTPTAPFKGNRMLKPTYSFRPYPDDKRDFDMEYFIQRPADGYMIIGGARTVVRTIKELVGNTDDTKTVPEMSKYLGNVVTSHFEEFGEPASGEGCVRQWTGIMGYTHSGLPYVGEIPGKKGQFISAGHHGHGMARTTLCSQGIAALMAGKTYSESGLPECFAPTYARFKQSDKSVYMMWLERFGETAGPEAEEAAAAKL